MSLGFIPSWQFSEDPAQNPNLSPTMQMPPGMFQTTVQPVGPYLNSTCADCAPQSGAASGAGGGALQGLGDPALDVMTYAVYNSWWWQNRQLLVIAGLAALALGVYGGIVAMQSREERLSAAPGE